MDEWVKGKIGIRPDQALSPERIQEYQLDKLAAVLAHAAGAGPFFRRRLAGHQTNGFRSYADLARLPFTTAADLKTAGLQMLCVSQSEIQRVVTLDTSGTMGRPKRVFFTAADRDLTVDFFRRGMATITRPGETVLILLPGERPGSLPDLLARALKDLGVRPVRCGAGHPPEGLLAVLAETRAEAAVGIPMPLLAAARYYALAAQKPPLNLRRLLLTTDYVAQAVVDEIQRVWNCEVFRYFGMTELGLGGGIECRRHDGYHLFEGDFLFEIVDPDSGAVLPEGEYGEVVVTTLTREGMPLVRYRTGDLARLTRAPCPCGSVLARLGPVKARKDGLVRVDPGRTLSMADLEELLPALPGVMDFTAVLSSRSQPSVLQIEVHTAGRTLDCSRVRRALQTHPALWFLSARDRLRITVKTVSDPGRYRPRAGKRRIGQKSF